MQKLILILLFSFNATFSIAFANTISNQTIVYCPREIQCMVNGDINACFISDDPYKIWDTKSSTLEGRIIKGTYRFKKSLAFYDAFSSSKTANRNLSFNNFDHCIYSNTDSLGIERLIGLNTLKNGMTGQIFEAYLGAKNQWSIVGYNAECFGDYPQSCPLVEIPELIICSRSI